MRIWCLALADLRLIATDRGALLWLLAMPLAFIAFFGLVLGGGSSPAASKATLTVACPEGDPLVDLFVAELEGEKIRLQRIPLEAREATPDKIRTLVIPEDFSDRLRAGEEVVLRLEKDPDTSDQAAMVAQTRIVRAIARFLGSLTVAAELEGMEEIDPELLSRALAAEDLVRLDARLAGVARQVPGGFAQSFPGNVVMFVLLVSLTHGAASLTQDRTSGLLRRLLSTPASPGEIVLGKVLGRLLVALAQVTLLAGAGLAAQQILGLPLGDRPLALLAVLYAYALGVAPLGVLLGAWFRDPDRASTVGVLATLALAAFGGCWWPIEVVSPALQGFSLALPTGWAMRGLHQVISFGGGWAEIAQPLAVLLGFAGVFTLGATRALRWD